ncbi:hypothetical protein FRX31_018841 [Thalictrum thalictroides]|uniref:Uncharacterized protein n=1 Tax=Thalictrum thalictroides TaxID=46969 RepID=A0A7J6W4Y0_THATH|nr:hypothetical protein FRX31_018841 [Thalictrum thalictroides]
MTSLKFTSIPLVHQYDCGEGMQLQELFKAVASSLGRHLAWTDVTRSWFFQLIVKVYEQYALQHHEGMQLQVEVYKSLYDCNAKVELQLKNCCFFTGVAFTMDRQKSLLSSMLLLG